MLSPNLLKLVQVFIVAMAVDLWQRHLFPRLHFYETPLGVMHIIFMYLTASCAYGRFCGDIFNDNVPGTIKESPAQLKS